MATESLIVELDAKTSKLDSKLKTTGKNMDKLDDSVKKTEADIAKMSKTAVIGITAAATAISFAVVEAGRFAREIEVAANRSGETVERMQALSFATNTVGVSLEKLGDISKDTNEKIGEFMATGGGGFVDFIDVMRLSREEANALAAEFQTMSGTDVLQEMVRRMEQAGISTNQMSFALEGVASDTTDLIPLLRDGSKELNRLTSEFEAIGATLSQEQIDKIKAVNEEFVKLGATFAAENKMLVAEYSKELIAAMNALAELAIVGTDALNLISAGWGNLIELAKAGLNDLVNGTDTFAETLEERTKLTTEALEKLMGESAEGIEILITEGSNQLNSSVKNDKLKYKEKLDIFSKYTKAASIINAAFFEENKAIQAGIIVADTATGIMRAFATSSNIYEAYANAAVVAATGLAQLSNLQSAGKGGGSISEGSSGGGGVSSAQQVDPQQDEISSLNLTSQDEDSASVLTVRFETDSGDAFLDALAEGLNNNERQGR